MVQKMFHKDAVLMVDAVDVMPRLRQDELEYALHQHSHWLLSGGTEGKRASFRDADLRGCDMRGANLSYASLRGANMQGLDVSNAIFQEADLTDAKMSGANARGCNFFRANLTGVVARGAVFSEAYMASAQCMNADFSEADLVSATLREAVLRSADFSAANLSKADLGMAICRGTLFNYTIFDHALLQQADMRDAQMRHAVLSQAKLHNAQFKDARLEGVSLLDVDFSVALDIAPEFQAQLIEQARHLIAVEREAMMSDRVRLLQEENALKELKMQLEGNIAHTVQVRASQDTAARMMVETGGKLKQLSWVWFAMLTGYFAVMAWVAQDIPYENLQLQEAGIISAVMIAVMIMFMSTTWMCVRAAKMMMSRPTLEKDF